MSGDDIDLFGGGDVVAGREAPADQGLPPAPPRRHVVETDAYDVADWHVMYAKAPALQSIQMGWERKFTKLGADEGCAASLLSDLWHACHKQEPGLCPSEGLGDWTVPAHRVMGEIMGDDEYSRLHTQTALDPIGAALAVKDLSQVVAKRYVEIVEEMKQQQERQPGDDPNGGPGDGGDGNGSDGGQDNNGSPDGGDSGNGGQGQQPSGPSPLSQAIKQAADSAGKDSGSRDLGELAGAGRDAAKPGSRVHPGSIDMAAKVLADQSGKFRSVIAQLGRLCNVARKAARGTMAVPSFESVDVAMGDDLHRILGSEMLRACSDDPVAEFDFFNAWADRQLLQYGSPVLKHRGPIVVLLDMSGSMQGKSEVGAKAATLATVILARRQNREVWVVPYNGDAWAPINLSEGTPVERVVELINLKPCGGTQYEPAIASALDLIETRPATLRKTDIFNITDGDPCSPDDTDLIARWRRDRQRHGVRYVEMYIDDADESQYARRAPRGRKTQARGFALYLPNLVDAHLEVHSTLRGASAEEDLSRVWAGVTDRVKREWAAEDAAATTGGAQ